MTAPRRVVLGARLFVWALPGLAFALLAPNGFRLAAALGFDALLALAFWFDARQLLRCPVHGTRHLASRLCLDQETTIGLSLSNASNLTLSMLVRDEPPPQAATSGHAILSARLQPQGTTDLTYRLTPRRRGAAQFGDVHLRVESAWHLAAVDVRIPQGLEVRVMPASFATRRALQRGLGDELGGARARLSRTAQAGGELESLREYVTGDPLRSIDWNATARRGHPITRVFQPERNQTLWLVLDASRTMATALHDQDLEGLGTRTRFDLALEAALELAHRALGVGDQVGVLVYAQRRVALVAPRHGRLHERSLIDATLSVMPESVQLDVRGLVAEIERCAKKRSLIVLFTDLDNESHGRLLSDHAPRLQRKHITLLVSLDDALTQALANTPAESEVGAYLQAAAADQLEDRARLRARLVTRGVGVLEAAENKLFAAALERYLELKTSQRL